MQDGPNRDGRRRTSRQSGQRAHKDSSWPCWLRRRLKEWEDELPKVTHSLGKIIIEAALFIIFLYGVWALLGVVLAAHHVPPAG